MMNPEDLLPEDQYLLGVDPEDLAALSKDRRQVWQAELETAVAAAEHATTRLNSPPECKHEDVQAAHFKPKQTRRCIYEAGRRWYKAKKTKQNMRWKHYNFVENIEINSDSSNDERQLRHDPNTDKREQCKRNQRQPNLNAWLKEEGSQKFKRQQKK